MKDSKDEKAETDQPEDPPPPPTPEESEMSGQEKEEEIEMEAEPTKPRRHPLYCYRCGFENETGDRYCGSCRAKIVFEAESPATYFFGLSPEHRAAFVQVFAGIGIFLFLTVLSAFLLGQSCQKAENEAERAREAWRSRRDPWSHPEKDQKPSRSVCDLFPNEPVCKAARKPGATVPPELCFASPDDESFDLNELRPDECTQFGLFGLIDLEDLRSDENVDIIPVQESQVPASIRPHFGKAKGVTSRSILVSILLIGQANGEDMIEDLMQDPKMINLVRQSAIGDELTEDERKAIGQILSLYNSLIAEHLAEVSALRAQFRKECQEYRRAGYSQIPVRCLAVSPPTEESEDEESSSSGPADPFAIPPPPPVSASPAPDDTGSSAPPTDDPFTPPAPPPAKPR